MALGKLPVPESPNNFDYSREGPFALAVDAGGGVWAFFLLSVIFLFFSVSLWETARYRLNYCPKGPLSPKQPTNQPHQDIKVIDFILTCLRKFFTTL